MTTDEYADQLLNEVLVAISNGKKKIVVWGVTPAALKLLSSLNGAGVISNVVALVDESPQLHNQQVFHLRIISPNILSSVEIDTLVISYDREKEYILERFAEHHEGNPHVIFSGKANYEFDDTVYDQITKSCLVKSKAGGYPNMLIHLFQSLKQISTLNLQGHVAEFGVFQGGTTVFMAKVLKHFGHSAKIYGFDTFKGFPARKSVFDLFAERKCEFHDFDSVRTYCEHYNIELIVGDISDTYSILKDVPLVLSFFDTDNYSSVIKALELCADQTVKNGILAFDHFFSPEWSRTIGERIAIRKVLSNKPFFNLYGTGIFIKN